MEPSVVGFASTCTGILRYKSSLPDVKHYVIYLVILSPFMGCGGERKPKNRIKTTGGERQIDILLLHSAESRLALGA